MNVALAYNLNRNNEEFEADFDTQDIIDRLLRAIGRRHRVEPLECDRNVESWAAKLRKIDPDLVFNVTEGYRGLGREAFGPIVFEQLGYSYTGPKTKDLVVCQDKAFVKRSMSLLGVPTPRHAVLTPGSPLILPPDLACPLFVKLNGEGSSLGVDARSKASTPAAALEKAESLLARHGSPVLVEEFFEGVDLSVNYVEGIGFPDPMQYRYPDGKEFYDYDLKIHDYQEIGLVRPRIPADTLARIFADCRKIVEFLGISRYCRIEVRWNESTGKYVFIEVNGQVCFLENGSFVESMLPRFGFDDFIDHIIGLENVPVRSRA